MRVCLKHEDRKKKTVSCRQAARNGLTVVALLYRVVRGVNLEGTPHEGLLCVWCANRAVRQRRGEAGAGRGGGGQSGMVCVCVCVVCVCVRVCVCV